MQISIIVKIKKCSVFYHRYDWDHWKRSVLYALLWNCVALSCRS
jgi:hypothetical protein